MKYCPYCGTKLKETMMLDKSLCPNHGLIEEDKLEDSDSTPSYVK